MIGHYELEVVRSYQYLGVTISWNGSFISGICELAQKGREAWFAMRSNIQIDMVNNPKIYLKLFDSMIKPILTYGSEVWSQQFFKIYEKNNWTTVLSLINAPPPY